MSLSQEIKTFQKWKISSVSSKFIEIFHLSHHTHLTGDLIYSPKHRKMILEKEIAWMCLPFAVEIGPEKFFEGKMNNF